MRSLSIVIPVFNEEKNIGTLLDELAQALSRGNIDYEIIVVDDGSVDGTLSELERAVSKFKNLKVIQFRRNFGQTAALQAGLDYSTKENICFMDGDLQNDPADIPRLLDKLYEGYDLVCGWRLERKDNWFLRTLPSRLAAAIISRVTGVYLHDFGSPLKVMKKDLACQFRLYGDMHRFIPVLAKDIGASIVEVPVNHRKRQFGKSKYGLGRTFRVLLDLVWLKFLLGYSKKPLHFFGYPGIFAFLVGLAVVLKVVYDRFFSSIPAGDRPLLMFGIMLIVIAVQFIFSGILAELLVRTYHESQRKPIYSIRKVLHSISSKEDLLKAGNL
jgi:glycosyltransferase involved in cell wall biosynthesis